MYTVYKIENERSKKFYIGSTTQELQFYFKNNIAKYKCNSQFKRLKLIFDDGIEYCKIYVIELCNDKQELIKKEDYYIRLHINNINCVNCIIPLRSRQEYLRDNYEKIKEYQRAYKRDYYHRVTKHKIKNI